MTLLLYDIPTRDGSGCWSPNPWKTRLALNYKGIPYKTEWLEYPEITPKLSSLGIPPRPPGGIPNVPYTIPTVRLPSGALVMDSANIAPALEAAYPSHPSLHLDSPLWARIEALVPSIIYPLAGLYLPRVPEVLLGPASAADYHAKREGEFGMHLSRLAAGTEVEGAWAQAGTGFRELAGLLRASGGPFLMGAMPSYADFVVVSMLHAFRLVDEGLWARAVGQDASIKALYEGCAPWLARATY
ncbi:hypothetical protein EJ06DRAFT_537261 [Trichodelitschia bisporula]|uniref:Uncharacterized protein n=1 Tax=Trichodelitschia bisporula TaxID=703511 RepID=A0A6G1I1G0_9PEZI|nr:hypothetical protein EJ06DRAFT_537261 [Trichodelitschia bisporula]